MAEYNKYAVEINKTAADTFRYLNFDKLPDFVATSKDVDLGELWWLCFAYVDDNCDDNTDVSNKCNELRYYYDNTTTTTTTLSTIRLGLWIIIQERSIEIESPLNQG